MIETKLESLAPSEKTNPRSIKPFSSSNSRSDKLLLIPFFLLLPRASVALLGEAFPARVSVEFSSSLISLPEKMGWSFGTRIVSGEKEPGLKLVAELSWSLMDLICLVWLRERTGFDGSSWICWSVFDLELDEDGCSLKISRLNQQESKSFSTSSASIDGGYTNSILWLRMWW